MNLKIFIFALLVAVQPSLAQPEDAPELPPLDTTPSEPLPEPTEPLPEPLEPPPALEPAPELEPAPSDLQQEFQDPFSNPAPEIAPDAPIVPPAEELPAPPPFEEPQLPNFQDSNTFAPPAAPDGSQPLQSPVDDRAKPFEFPQVGDQETNQGPVTQTVVDRSHQRQTSTEGTWSLTSGFGGAMNINKAQSQVSFEISGNYRVGLNWDIGLTTYFRFFDVKYLGILAQTMYYFRLTDPESFRMELGLGGGLGWTLRATKSSFNESRFPVRAQSDLLFYATPKFAVVVSMAIESFIFGLSKGKGVNFLKDGGPPTQGIGHLGVRFEF